MPKRERERAFNKPQHATRAEQKRDFGEGETKNKTLFISGFSWAQGKAETKGKRPQFFAYTKRPPFRK